MPGEFIITFLQVVFVMKKKGKFLPKLHSCSVGIVEQCKMPWHLASHCDHWRHCASSPRDWSPTGTSSCCGVRFLIFYMALLIFRTHTPCWRALLSNLHPANGGQRAICEGTPYSPLLSSTWQAWTLCFAENPTLVELTSILYTLTSFNRNNDFQDSWKCGTFCFENSMIRAERVKFIKKL